MFQVSQFYRTNKTFATQTQRLRAFPELHQAIAFARGEYERLSQVPESKAIEVSVIDLQGQVIYTAPQSEQA